MNQAIASPKVIKTLRATVELLGLSMSDDAAEIFVEDISGFPDHQIIGALARCRKEVRGRLTPRDVIDRLEDGRLSPDEAWAQVPKSEYDSIVWTNEMAHAWSMAAPAWADGDRVAAARAFRDAYVKAVSYSRDNRIPAEWSVSLGSDRQQAFNVVEAAVRNKQISLKMGLDVVPDLPNINSQEVLKAIAAPLPDQTPLQLARAQHVAKLINKAVKGATPHA
ncbi:MAG: hypothetical protein KKD97_16065 [Gammaproteobacteria bacterium]|nr:hypothetical protein [Gammaproteobacteria bacterium]